MLGPSYDTASPEAGSCEVEMSRVREKWRALLVGAEGRAGGGQLSCQELRAESVAEGEQAALGQTGSSHECG